jgi:hypothetical protein
VVFYVYRIYYSDDDDDDDNDDDDELVIHRWAVLQNVRRLSQTMRDAWHVGKKPDVNMKLPLFETYSRADLYLAGSR